MSTPTRPLGTTTIGVVHPGIGYHVSDAEAWNAKAGLKAEKADWRTTRSPHTEVNVRHRRSKNEQ